MANQWIRPRRQKFVLKDRWGSTLFAGGTTLRTAFLELSRVWEPPSLARVVISFPDSRQVISNVTLRSRIDMSNALIEHIEIKKSAFIASDLRLIHVHMCKLENVTFNGTPLLFSWFANSSFNEVTFTSAILSFMRLLSCTGDMALSDSLVGHARFSDSSFEMRVDESSFSLGEMARVYIPEAFISDT